MTEQNTLTIDGTEYNIADLSDDAKQQIANLRVADAELERLKSQIAIVQTARNTYARAVAEALPKH